jgi:hypothetical protein
VLFIFNALLLRITLNVLSIVHVASVLVKVRPRCSVLFE